MQPDEGIIRHDSCSACCQEALTKSGRQRFAELSFSTLLG